MSGGLLLASKSNAHLEFVLDFVKPIGLSETRSVRKALEMTGGGQQLLCDGAEVLGLARLRNSYLPSAESAFVFSVMSRGVWELSHNQVPMLRVTNTRPTLPQPHLDPQHFVDVAQSGRSPRSMVMRQMPCGSWLTPRPKPRTEPCWSFTGTPVGKPPDCPRKHNRFARSISTWRCWLP